MADNFNNNDFNKNKDDIDDFFAQFDQPVNAGPADPAPEGRSSAGRRSSSGKRSRRGITGRSASSAKRGGRSKPASAKRSAGDGGRGSESRGKKVLKLVCLAFIAVIMAVGIYVGIVFATAPDVDTDDIYSMLSQRSVMYDADGNEIENLYFSDGNRTIVDYDEIPEDMINAVVAIEDRNFWDHNGFNFVRMAGAVVDSVFGGGQISGTSTITQQLARNIYLSDIKSQRSISRKLMEAYCTIILEKNLSKEQIMEAYLNTISLGFNSYGVQAASQAYFSKDVQELDTLECAALAALPQSPTSYALVVADYEGTNSSSLPTISSTDSVTYLYNGDISKTRRDSVLSNMADEGYITAQQRDDALADDLRGHIRIGVSSDADASSYFTDYAIDELTDDIIEEYGYSYADARDMIYTGGLEIYTTMDSNIQNILEEEFAEGNNFAGIAYVRRDGDGNILGENGDILLYDESYYFNDDGQFTLSSGEYRANDDGGITILKDGRLNIYETEVNGEPDVSVEFKGMYVREGGTFYFIEGGALSIPQGYKTIDGDGNVVISGQFFKDYPEFFVKSGDSYVVSSNNYSLKQKVIQPQAASVIIENSTGEIKAMMGGRGTSGRRLHNRATSPRQPGSSIKPISVYGPALQMSFEYERDNQTMRLDTSDGSDWGEYITAGSIINDSPIQYNGRSWPKNVYSGYRGQMTLRHAVQQSVNTCAVKTYQQIGPDYSSSMLKKVGVTTVHEEGKVNDLNPAALALGGMTEGISPLEMAGAYTTFANGGIYKDPISYTRVLNSDGETLFEKTADEERVYNEGVAWIMTDIMRTVVTSGGGSNAAIGSQPVAGKTGTTSDKYDIWFCGFTPQYTCSLWMGNDINLDLTASSPFVASFWSEIMSRVCEGLPRGSFFEKPDNVETVNGEYYTDGTYSSVKMRSSGGSSTAGSTTQKQTTEAPATHSTTTTAPSSSQATTIQPQTPPEDDPAE